MNAWTISFITLLLYFTLLSLIYWLKINTFVFIYKDNRTRVYLYVYHIKLSKNEFQFYILCWMCSGKLVPSSGLLKHNRLTSLQMNAYVILCARLYYTHIICLFVHVIFCMSTLYGNRVMWKVICAIVEQETLWLLILCSFSEWHARSLLAFCISTNTTTATGQLPAFIHSESQNWKIIISTSRLRLLNRLTIFSLGVDNACIIVEAC